MPYEYYGSVSRVVDGDTFDINLQLGFNVNISERIRMAGIDTPESRTRNKAEKKLGLASKARLKELLALAQPLKRGRKKMVLVKTSKQAKGKFGRILGEIWVGDINVNQTLIDEGYAREYWGGSKGELGPWVKDGQRWTADGYVDIEEAR
jgi:micrococcal nuclease